LRRRSPLSIQSLWRWFARLDRRRPRPSASAEALGLEKLPFRHITQMIYVVVT